METNPVKAIRAKCLDCCCDQANEVKLCPVKDCSHWPCRFGKNPYRTRTLTPEQREAAAERLSLTCCPGSDTMTASTMPTATPTLSSGF